MKKLHACILTTTLFITSITLPATAAGTEKTPYIPTAKEAAIIEASTARLNEINAMDKSTLTAAEKKELRKEVRAIKKDIKDSGGVYLSVGALILVIILLIILL